MQRYAIKPYFIAAGKALTYDDQRRQMLCSLEDKPFPVFPEELQEHTFFEFGSIEEHFKYRDAVMKAYRNSLDLRWHRSKTQHPSLVGADIRQSQEPHQHRCYYLHST